MAKVEPPGSKGIQISQLPVYTCPAPKEYELVDDASDVTKTMRGWLSPVTRAMIPVGYKAKAGGQRMKEIGQTGYAHTMTTVEGIRSEPNGPLSIVAGSTFGVLLSAWRRGGKISKLLFALAGGGAGAALYYNQETIDLSVRVYNSAMEKFKGESSEQKSPTKSPETSTETKDSSKSET